MVEKLRDRGFDEQWKKILSRFFKDFLYFYFPNIAKQIDHNKGYTFLDKEMAKIMRKAANKSRRADTLVKVYLQDQKEVWLLTHIEVQNYDDAEFGLRMYTYSYRSFELYQKPIASLAILADNHKNFRPDFFTINAFGKDFMRFEFLIHKILDWQNKQQELEQNPNPFAVVTLASLRTYEKDVNKRFASKFYLTKMLYQRGYDKETILALYEFLDGIIVLPEKMELKYNQKIAEYEEEKQMPYITTAERIGIQKGKIEGKIEEFLDSLAWMYPEFRKKYEEQIKSIKTEEEFVTIKTKIRKEIEGQK